MSSRDRWQVTHVISVLRGVLSLADPVAVIQAVTTTIRAVADPPPGDPARLRELARSFRAAGGDVAPVAAEVRDVGGNQLPAGWRSQAGNDAATVVTAAADLLDAVGPAFALAADALDDHADTVERLRRRHGELTQRLHDIWHDASHVTVLGVDVAFIDLGRITRLAGEALSVVGELRNCYEESLSAADECTGRLGDVRGRARAAVNATAGSSAADAVVLADTVIGGTDLDSAILSQTQAVRATQLRAGLSDADRVRLDALLAGAATPEERAYLLKAFAAGHPVAEVAAFDAQIHGRDPSWLRANLSLVDPGLAGEVWFRNQRLRQYDATTCGSTSILVARAMTDPIYAFQLTCGGDPAEDDPDGGRFRARLAAEEQRIHDRTNTVWPQALGTSPWGVAGELDDHAGSLGTGYDWRLVDDTDPRSVDPALARAVRAVDTGQPVPVLIGDGYPRHYVLLVGHDGGDLVFYDPSGDVVRVSEREFRDGGLGALGFGHVQAVILPTGG